MHFIRYLAATVPDAVSPKVEPRVEIEGKIPFLQLAGDARFRFFKVQLPIPGLSRAAEGFRFIHLTDLHLRDRWEPVLEKAIPGLMSGNPQAILFTGDLMENKRDHTAALPHARRLLEAIRTPLGTFAVTGNHDNRDLQRNLRTSPIEFIMNRRVDVGPVELVGLSGRRWEHVMESTWTETPEKRAGIPRIVLCHYPWLIRKAAVTLKPDIYLAGHTHGGQVCLPGGKVIVSHDRLEKKFAAGLHRWGETWLNVSRGLGFSDWQIRMFCAPKCMRWSWYGDKKKIRNKVKGPKLEGPKPRS